MRRLTKRQRLLAIMFALLACCAPGPSRAIAGAWQHTTASVYYPWEGTHFADGGTYTAGVDGVANRWLPFGTRIESCNRRDGHTFCARTTVVDRGPYVAGRDLDYTIVAAHHVACPGLCYVAWRVVPAPPPAIPDIQGFVVRTKDGDTYVVRTGAGDVTVRALGIDTPELRHPGIREECGGRRAAELARVLLVGKRVVLRGDPVAGDRDRFGRLLRYVFVGPRTFQRRLVRAGYAKVYRYHGEKLRLAFAWQDEQDTAAQVPRGVWAACPAARAQRFDYTHAWSTGPAR